MESLVESYRAGQTELRNEIIEILIPQAKRHVARFKRAHPNQRDEIDSMAMAALCHTVMLAQTQLRNNSIRPYVNVAIRGAVHKAIAKDRLIPIPPDKYREITKDADDPSEALAALAGQLATRFVFIDTDKLSYVPHESRLGEMLSALQLSYKERVILELRVQGCTLREIAAQLELSEPGVLYHIRQVGARYQRACAVNPNLPKPKEK